MAHNFQAHGMDGTTTAIAKISGMVHQQAMMMSFMDVFYLLTVLFSSLAVFALLMRKPPASASGGGGH
jgi:DHA2 family multidrug resistance protein